MKIPRMRHQISQERRQVAQMSGDEVRHLALPLELAVDRQQARTEEFAPLPLGKVVPDDDVDVAGLVLQREEGDAARGARALAVEDEAGGTHEATVRQTAEFLCGEQPFALQAAAQQRKRMAPKAQAQAGVVGDEILAFGKGEEFGLGFRHVPHGKRRRALDAGDVPVGLPAMAGQPGERAGGGEALEVARVDAAACEVFDAG